MELKKVENIRLLIENRKFVMSNLLIFKIIGIRQSCWPTTDDQTPRDLDLVETIKFLAESDCDCEFVAYLIKTGGCLGTRSSREDRPVSCKVKLEERKRV